MTADCYIIGHGKLTKDCLEILQGRGHMVRGVVSNDRGVRAWCQSQAVPLLQNEDALQRQMAAEPADYLFSIINPAKVPPALLALPRLGAINYHDGPLPRYAGLHVSSWAVQNQETEHGVSWHQMSTEFDSGAVLVQQRFPMDPAETAFSLSLKSHAQGLLSFEQLLSQIENGALAPQIQDLSKRTVFLSHQRPADLCLLDWRWPADRLEALVRGLDFGSDDNPLGLPKFLLDGQFYLLTEAVAQPVAVNSDLAAGSIIALREDGLQLACGSGALTLTQVRELTGAAVPLNTLVDRHQLQVGGQIEESSQAIRAALSTLDQRCVASELRWRRRLRACEPLTPFDAPLGAVGDIVSMPLPQDVVSAAHGAFPQADPADLLAALYYAFLMKLHGKTGDCVGLAVADAHALCANVVPFSAPLDAKQNVAQALAALCASFAARRDDGSYLADLLPRTPSLEAPQLPIVIVREDAELVRQRTDRQAITLRVGQDGAAAHFDYDSGWLSAAQVQRHLDLFAAFANNAVGQTEQPLQSLSLLGDAERTQVLRRWNATAFDISAQSTLVEQIITQAQQRSSEPALVYRDQTLTYAQLMERANALASVLRSQGAGLDSLVGIYLPRCNEMVVSMLGVMLAGAAYVPLDPTYPDDRIRFMIDDANLPLLITDAAGAEALADTSAQPVRIDELTTVDATMDPTNNPAALGLEPANLAYVIYTSGSTGKPKGVMIEHGNLINFACAMDRVLDYQGEPGVWLAVTSMSFDISVLELLWTLSRGFKVVVQEDTLAARAQSAAALEQGPLDFSLFYFSSDAGPKPGAKPSRYRLLMEGARFADSHGFSAIWTPERHFHLFGGLYPNPSVTSAAVAAVTENIAIRAGSIVLPLHNPIRVVEEWSVVDNLSNGRVGFSFASGWHANDFALLPENYADRKQLMFDNIKLVQELWQGKPTTLTNGEGKSFEATVFPTPVQSRPPVWVTAAGNLETFTAAGRSGYNLLTNLLGQTVAELQEKIQAYQDGRKAAGVEGKGIVSVMVHTFVGEDVEQVRAIVKGPFCHYLKTSFDLVKIAPWAFPAFSQPSKAAAQDASFDPDSVTEEDLDALVDHAFDRYFETAGIFGTPESVLPLVGQLKAAGVTELACLIDFGVDEKVVLDNLVHLNALRLETNAAAGTLPATAIDIDAQDYSLAKQIERHAVTHFQCTPSLARLLWAEPEQRSAFARLHKVLLGGEALPADLAQQVSQSFSGELVNVYGPTETTIWSTSTRIDPADPSPTIGRPFLNTQVYILDEAQQPLPVGVAGELCIGGLGVVRGYLERPQLTAEKFLPDTFAEVSGQKLYRTGDLAAWREDGTVQFLGRLDHQVKLRGYRIELGEIEARINQIAGVAESVVVAQDNAQGEAALVAYLVPQPAATQKDGTTTVQAWQSLWDEAYRFEDDAPTPATDPTLNTSGWLNSFTGEPHAEEHMREWIDATVERVLALKPKRVLEIGCGTGMVLYRVAPHCESYHGIDVSATGLASIRAQLPELGLTNVTLSQRSADDLPTQPDQGYDLVIINSVCQYFPSGEYLANVVDASLAVLAPAGHIFVGDVRAFAQLPLFQQTLVTNRVDPQTTADKLREQIAAGVRAETELLCDPEFFAQLQCHNPKLAAVNVRLKKAQHHNEMSMFRYDVVLQKQGGKVVVPEYQCLDARALPELHGLQSLQAKVATLKGNWHIQNLSNARLQGCVALAAEIESATTTDTAADLAARVQEVAVNTARGGIDPEAMLHALSAGAGRTVELRWAESADPGLMDLYVSDSAVSAGLQWQRTSCQQGSLHEYCNQPVAREPNQDLPSIVVQRLTQTLPDFMVPTDFVVLPELPLTPNGKIDRKRLPAPDQHVRRATVAFVAPSSEIEETIAQVFRAMLNIDSVGINDNFFDLGANSLLVVQANNRLSKALGRKVPLVTMYRYPTIASLAAQLGGEQDAAKTVSKGADRAARRRQARQGRRGRERGNR